MPDKIQMLQDQINELKEHRKRLDRRVSVVLGLLRRVYERFFDVSSFEWENITSEDEPPGKEKG